MIPTTIYSDDLVEIIHGDCRDVVRLDRLATELDLAFLDPPFNIGENYGSVSDRLDRDAFEDLIESITLSTFVRLPAHGVLWCHGPDDLADLWLDRARRSGTMKRLAWVNWFYAFGQCRSTNWIDQRCHGIAFGPANGSPQWFPDAVRIETTRRKMNDKRTRDRNGFRVPGTIWGIEAIDGPFWGRVQGNNAERVAGRPNQLPERYLERIIRAYTKRGDLVFDPFCGTGTTATVAKALGRRCITCDLDLDACNLAAARVQRGAVRVGKAQLWSAEQ